MKKSKNKKAFTLLEFLIYIGLIVVILTSSGAIALNVIYGKAKLKTIEEVSQNARFAMEKINDVVRNSAAITSPVPNGSASTLSLQMIDPVVDPVIIDVSGGVLRIQEGSNSPVNLTSEDVVISNIQFENISYIDTPGTIRVTMTVRYNSSSSRKEYDFEKTFYSTVNVKNR